MTTEAHEIGVSTARVLAALRDAVNRDHRRRRRRRRIAAVAAAALTVTSAAVAVGREWWTDAPPAADQRVVDFQLAPTRFPDGRLELLADPKLARTVARTTGAALVAAPSAKGNGGYCMLPQLPRLPGESAASAALGFGCVGRAAGPRGHGSTFATLTAERGGELLWFAYGRITDDAAAAVDLTEAAGEPLRVELGHGGFFITPLPRRAWARLDDRRHEVAVRERNGAVLRRTCVPFGPAPYSRVDPNGGGGIADAEGGDLCRDEGPTVQAPPVLVTPSAAPPLAGSDVLAGRTVRLGDFAGQPVVIEFWKSLCTNATAARHGCHDATLFELQTLRRARKVAVVSVAVRDRLGREELESLPRGYPHLTDADGALARAYEVDRFPTLVVLDAQHRVRARITGVPTEPELMRALRIATGDVDPGGATGG